MNQSPPAASHPAAAGLDFLAEIAWHSTGLADVAQANLSAPVVHCPGWSVGDLVDHVRQVHWFWAAVADGRLTAPPEDASAPPRPADPDLVPVFRDGARRLVDVLGAVEPTASVWTWAPAQQNIGFIQRHQVQEAAVHHWDAAHAAGPELTLTVPVAVDAIEEFLTFSVSSPADHPEKPRPDLNGGLVLRATDAPAAWTISDAELPGTVRFERRAADAAATVAGTASELLLWLYQRISLPAGDPELIDRFRALTFTN